MPQLVQRHAEDIRVGSDIPGLIHVEMHVARDRLRVRGRWIKGVGQDRAVRTERPRVAVVTAREDYIDRGRRIRVRSLLPGDLDHLGPFSHGAPDFRFGGAHRQLRAHRAEHVADSGGILPGATPSLPARRD